MERKMNANGTGNDSWHIIEAIAAAIAALIAVLPVVIPLIYGTPSFAGWVACGVGIVISGICLRRRVTQRKKLSRTFFISIAIILLGISLIVWASPTQVFLLHHIYGAVLNPKGK